MSRLKVLLRISLELRDTADCPEKSRHLGCIGLKEWNSQTVWRWMEAPANRSLEPNSLLTGKFTGNFSNLVQ